MSRWGAGALLLFAGCGSSGVAVDVALDIPAKAVLSPYDASTRVAFLRVGVDGSERLDESYQDFAAGTTNVTFEDYPVERRVRVIAKGFDELSNVVAYGEVSADVDTDDLALTLPFRRTLAYVTHRDICDGGCADGEVCANPGDGHRCVPLLTETTCGANGCRDPDSDVCIMAENGPRCAGPYAGRSQGASRIYAIDVSSKTLVDVITLPSPTLRATNVTNKGGEGVWVTFTDAGKSSAAFLSSSTHAWSAPIELSDGMDFTMGAPGQKYVVAAGNGKLGVFDESTRAKVREVPLGGRILDGFIGGLGDKALLVTSATLALLDLEDPESATAVNPGDLPGSSGAALSGDGRIAYVSSSSDGTVAAFDLIAGGSKILASGFITPVRNLVLSEEGQQLLGILTSDPSVFVGAYDIASESGLPIDRAVGTLPLPDGMASGAGGSRVIVVSAGTSTGSAGLTVVDPIAGDAPTGSTVTYLRDPTETYTQGGNTFRQRYRPNKVAALYGQ